MRFSPRRVLSVTLVTGLASGCSSAPRQTVAVVTPAPAAAAAAVRPNVTGNWLSAAPQADGTVRRTYFTLEQQGERITGSVHAPTSFVQITESAWDSTGTGFTIASVTRNGQNERRTTWEGRLVGDSLHMTMRRRVPPNAPPAAAANFRPVELVAHRVPAGEGALPAKIALPSRHPVKDNGIARTPAMGWNSWNKFAGRVDDASVREMADAMVSSGMKAAGYTYINIDDTWEGDARDAQGNITTNKKFPDMKALADYVHSKGLKIGIYSSPGPVTCAGYLGSYGHEAQDARTYAAWGIDYLKYDWCGASMLHPTEDQPALYQLMGDALQATGRDILYSLCQYGQLDVWKWGAEVGGNSWRTTGDIRDTWQSMANIGFRQDVIASYAKPGHFNDPDMLEIGNGGMTDTEYRTHMSLWSMLASPLLAGNDLRTMTPAIHDILTNREVIAIDQDSLGVQATRVWASDDSATVRKEIWTRPLAKGGNAVAVFNRGPDSAQVTVDFAKLGIDLRRKTVRDLWAHANVRVKGTQYAAMVPSHGVVMLRVGR